MAHTAKRVLIIVKSPITRDPRVRRQIQWLTEEGCEVDTVGPVGHHVQGVRTHFGVEHAPAWTRSRYFSPVLHRFVPHGLLFWFLLEMRIPRRVKQRIRRGDYNLVIFNDHHFLPWIRKRSVFTRLAINQGIHLDLHEYVRAQAARTTWQERFAAPYSDWVRSFIGSPRFSSRSTVARGIADLYAEEFDIPAPAVVRSAPAFVEQSPSRVNPQSIELLYHGAAHDNRGIPELLEAMRSVSSRFRLTLILVGDESSIARYKAQVAANNLDVVFAEPVAVDLIAETIRKFDVEVMFFPPRTRNLEFALPNKLFEAIQGRLALLIGASAMMSEIIDVYENGIEASGWTSQDLANAIESLDEANVSRMKENSHRAAHALSAETEREAFLTSIGL